MSDMLLHAECPGRIRWIEGQSGMYELHTGRAAANTYIALSEVHVRDTPRCLYPSTEPIQPHIKVSFPGTKISPFELVYCMDDLWMPPRKPSGSETLVWLELDS